MKNEITRQNEACRAALHKLLDEGQKERTVALRSMKVRHPDAIIIFRVGDFYECYGDDAKIASDVLDLTLVNATRSGEEIKLVGFPHHSLDIYLPKLVRAGNRVAICEPLTKKDNGKD